MTLNESPTISLFSLNTYLIPSFLGNEQANECKGQFQRANKIGKFASQYDVVVLQEVWGTAIEDIEKHLLQTHKVPPINKSWSLFGYFGDYINTARFYLKGNGGLYFAAKNEFPIVYNHGITFYNSKTRSRKGCQVSVINLDKVQSNHYLCVFYTHLDPLNIDRVQERQLTEIRNFMFETFQYLSKKVTFSNMGVLLVGDFNIDGFTKDYEMIFSFFPSIRDLYYEARKRNGLEIQNTYEPNKRIDYIFGMDKFEFKGMKFQFCKIFPSDANVLQNLQVSDHHAQELKFILKQD